MFDYADFLADVSDAHLRARLWDLFDKALAHAEQFTASGQTVSISMVAIGPGEASAAGRLAIADPADHGELLAEVFVPVFLQSRFNDGNADGKWRAAFCDAFRYFVERELGLADSSPWFSAMDALCDAPGPAPGTEGDQVFRQRRYPAALIIARAAKDYRLFQAIWFDLQEQRMQANQPLLDWKFGYTPTA